jgi:hypothetical protein
VSSIELCKLIYNCIFGNLSDIQTVAQSRVMWMYCTVNRKCDIYIGNVPCPVLNRSWLVTDTQLCDTQLSHCTMSCKYLLWINMEMLALASVLLLQFVTCN